MTPIDVVHLMEPRYLKSILSPSRLNPKTVNCILAALERYNKAVNAAGKKFEADIKKCLKPIPPRVRKPIAKKPVK